MCFIHTASDVGNVDVSLALDSGTDTEFMMANMASAYNGCQTSTRPAIERPMPTWVVGAAHKCHSPPGCETSVPTLPGTPITGAPCSASHSQGTHHAMKYSRRLSTSQLRERMVAANNSAVLIPLSPEWFAAWITLNPVSG